MDSDSVAGTYVEIESGRRAFIPPAPPAQLHYTDRLVRMLGEASRGLGRLDGLSEFGPLNVRLLVAPFLRIEAVQSSRIEGTRTSLEELLVAEVADTGNQCDPDVREVQNYVTALEYGLQRLRQLPICLRLVRELHERLLRGVRGDQYTPGQFRTGQVYIGTGGGLDRAIYIPPPANLVPDLMARWERYVAEPDPSLSVLIQCAIMHYQFEAIHPFFDGNGRVGRLLIILLLCARGVLKQPLLYLSAYLEAHRREYYAHLNGVTRENDWAGWLEFFLQAVVTQSQQAVVFCRRLLEYRDALRESVQSSMRTVNGLALIDMLFVNPHLTVPQVADHLGVSRATARDLIMAFIELGIVMEVPRPGRTKLYQAPRLLRMLEEAAEPPDRLDTRYP